MGGRWSRRRVCRGARWRSRVGFKSDAGRGTSQDAILQLVSDRDGSSRYDARVPGARACRYGRHSGRRAGWHGHIGGNPCPWWRGTGGRQARCLKGHADWLAARPWPAVLPTTCGHSAASPASRRGASTTTGHATHRDTYPAPAARHRERTAARTSCWCRHAERRRDGARVAGATQPGSGRRIAPARRSDRRRARLLRDGSDRSSSRCCRGRRCSHAPQSRPRGGLTRAVFRSDNRSPYMPGTTSRSPWHEVVAPAAETSCSAAGNSTWRCVPAPPLLGAT